MGFNKVKQMSLSPLFYYGCCFCGIYSLEYIIPSNHLCPFDRLISMPAPTGKQRRLICYIHQEGALLITPLDHKTLGGN